MSPPLANQDTIKSPAARKCFVGGRPLKSTPHKGIERRPQLRAIAILRLQDFVTGCLDQAVLACRSRAANRFNCGGCYDGEHSPESRYRIERRIPAGSLNAASYVRLGGSGARA